MEPPTRVSKIIHRHSKVIAVLITKRLAKTDWTSYKERGDLAGWINGLTLLENNPDAKLELKELRRKVLNYGNQ